MDVSDARTRKGIHRWERIDAAWMIGLAAAFFILGLPNLGTPGEPIYDEVYHARSAKEFIAGASPYDWTHPHLGKLMIAAGMLATRRADAFGWRIASLLAGCLTLPVVYALGRRLFASR